MPNLLDNIQSCQYNSSIAVGDTIGKVKNVQNPRADVDVIPVIEGGRKVYTAVEVAAGNYNSVLDTTTPLIQTSTEPAGATDPIRSVYGALETVNTATQRCGVLTDGVVIFRKTSATGADDGESGDIGRNISGPIRNPTSGGENNGSVSVTVSVPADLNKGKGAVLAYDGPYLLVDLGAN